MKCHVIVFLIILHMILVGCRVENRMTVETFYLRSLNLDQIPREVSDLQGEGSDSFPEFLSKGYFRYKADPMYFETLEKHTRFAQNSEFNDPVHRVTCRGDEMPKDYTYWTQERVQLENRQCFTGTFFPYVHYIIYNTNTKEVLHFVTAMRD